MAEQQTKRITIQTPGGTMHVWTQRNGSSPSMRLLLLHGGPGATHDYFRSFESWFPQDIELIYYDQLGSANSDNPEDQWPEEVERAFGNINQDLYVYMQGPSEFGISGTLETWDRSADLSRITVPTLVIGAEHDTMDPGYMGWMARELPKGEYLYCPDGSHMAMWEDPETYHRGVERFIRRVSEKS